MTEAELEEIREDLGPLKDVWESPTIQPEQKVVALSDYLRDVESLLSEVERLREWCYPDAPCRGCELPVLRAEVERLRGGLRAILDQHREISEGSRRAHCEVCYPQDGVYPCVTVLEARAALEGRE
jgi:hypothetical protein